MRRLIVPLVLGLASAGAYADESWRLSAPVPREDAAFGFALAASGGWLAIGAPGEDEGAGAVYLGQCSDGLCTWNQRLVAPERDDGAEFGAALVAQGTRLVVGSPGDGHGVVDVFELVGGEWEHETRLSAFDGEGGDRFGHALALDDDALIVGAPRANASRGAVYAFRRGPFAWQQSELVLASSSSAGDRFGHALALDAGQLWIGAPLRDTDGGGAGHAQGSVFRFVDAGDWNEVQRLDGTQSGDRFGWSVTTRAARTAIGAPGSDLGRGLIRVYAPSGMDWQETDTLTRASAQPGDRLGWQLQSDGLDLLAGVPLAGLAPGSACGLALRWLDAAPGFTSAPLRLRAPALATLAGWSMIRVGQTIHVGVPASEAGGVAGAGVVLGFDLADDVLRDGFERGASGCVSPAG